VCSIVTTNQRLEILTYLNGNRAHPSVDEVYEAVRRKLPAISRATVYRNLKQLADQGLIQEVLIKGVIRYEPNTEPHHHVVCMKCGKIMDFMSEQLTDYSLSLGREFEDFRIETTTTNFFGVCSICSEEKADCREGQE